MRQLRACLVCSLVKTPDQFETDGCDNCENFLHLKRNRENVMDCTSSKFEGMIASCKPRDSWVCKVLESSILNYLPTILNLITTILSYKTYLFLNRQ